MFLRGNLRARGIGGADSPEGNYFGAFDGSRLVGIASHSWTDMMLVQAPDAAELAVAAAVASRRQVAGISGPYEQAMAARGALGMAGARTAMDSCETLFALALSELVAPADGESWRVRPPLQGEIALLADWRGAYGEEALGIVRDEEAELRAAADIARWSAEGVAFVLEVEDEPASFAAFNAKLPDIVQIGGVWTPPAMRGRGYATAVVAGALQSARASGATRAVLFTGDENRSATRTYEKLGFRRIGSYGLIIFRR
jgi:GNAT superfamily N-acetyltransferase